MQMLHIFHISENISKYIFTGKVTPQSLVYERPILSQRVVCLEGSKGDNWVSFLPSLERGRNEEQS